jgi:hypothetical protein
MKISVTFALGLFLALDILAMSVSCVEPDRPGSQQGQPAPSAQPAAAGEGQACRDQIVHCYADNDGHPTCPYPGQKIEVSVKGSGCNEASICICRCPAAPIPKTDSQ